MEKNVMKICVVLLLAVLCITAITPIVKAEKWTTKDSTNVERFEKNAEDNTGAAKAASNVLGSALIVVQVIGVGVAVIMLVVLAIKYISAAPGDKAEIKKHAVVYVVGAIVLFAASGILSLIRKFATGIENTINES